MARPRYFHALNPIAMDSGNWTKTLLFSLIGFALGWAICALTCGRCGSSCGRDACSGGKAACHAEAGACRHGHGAKGACCMMGQGSGAMEGGEAADSTAAR